MAVAVSEKVKERLHDDLKRQSLHRGKISSILVYIKESAKAFKQKLKLKEEKEK